MIEQTAKRPTTLRDNGGNADDGEVSGFYLPPFATLETRLDGNFVTWPEDRQLDAESWLRIFADLILDPTGSV